MTDSDPLVATMHGVTMARQVCNYKTYKVWVNCYVLFPRLMLTIAMYIPGCDKESKLLRKTLMQNCNLMAVLVFRSISESVRTRLKSLEDVVNAGVHKIRSLL